jgi:hypothetical protein
MRNYWLGLMFLFLSAALAGCGSAEEASSVYQPPPSLMGDHIDLSLADALKQSRSELANHARELEARIAAQEKGIKEGRLHLILLPNFRLPKVAPVLREARYAERAGISLPPYAPENGKDTALAVHLARYGDNEAANQLVDRTDGEAVQQIEAARYERNYPVEWTRLVGLVLHAAQLRLAAGDVDGGTEVVVVHRQLRALLDSRAAHGPLGAALLGRGRDILVQAAAAWRDNKKNEVAAQADAALAEWGDVPAPNLPFPPGSPRARASLALGSPGNGRLVQAASANRALDLLDLPFPEQGADGAVAWFDQADRLTDVLLTYRSGFAESFPDPAGLAYLLQESRVDAKELPPSPGLRPRTYSIEQTACDVNVVAHGAGLGAWVHVHGGAGGNDTPLARDFGGFHLDRSFEQNRLRLAPEQRGETVTIKQPQALADVRNPIPLLKPTQATLLRDKEHDLAAGLTLRYPTSENGPPELLGWLVPLGSEAGRPELQGQEDGQESYLALTWGDSRTRYRVRLPYEAGRPMLFEAADIQGSEHSAERQAAAAALDQSERQARLAAGKPLLLLPRRIDPLELGMSRAQVTQALPRLQSVIRRDIPGGLTATFSTEPAPGELYVLRQVFVRFDNADQAVEIRVRFADGAATLERVNWTANLLAEWQKAGGAPWQEPAPWANVWTDSAGGGPGAAYYLWKDDRTLSTYQRDAAGVEIVLRDCPEAHPAGAPLPAFQYLARGLDNAELGMTREQLLEKLGGGKPVVSDDGALVVPAPAGGVYDAVMVWFDKDRIARIVARHADKAGIKRDPAQSAQAVTEAWGRDIVNLGWPRRQDQGRTEHLQILGWNDERTRVRLFWQEDESGAARIYTEWKELAQ